MQSEFKEACVMPCRVLALIRELEHRFENADYEECDRMAAEVMRKTFKEFATMSDTELKLANEAIIGNLEHGIGSDRNAM